MSTFEANDWGRDAKHWTAFKAANQYTAAVEQAHDSPLQQDGYRLIGHGWGRTDTGQIHVETRGAAGLTACTLLIVAHLSSSFRANDDALPQAHDVSLHIGGLTWLLCRAPRNR
jgi:hypothetical protein